MDANGALSQNSAIAYDVLVIGGGVSGLTAAALAAYDGAKVAVLERHNVVGGCASFYQKNGFRFDVGATVAGGFGARGWHERIFKKLGVALPAERIDPAMLVHLPDITVSRFGDARWRSERRRVFGDDAESFWQHQEQVAALAWQFAATIPPLPRDLRSLWQLARVFKPTYLPLFSALGRSVGGFLPQNPRLRRFVDAQLLITAQSTADHTDWLYGATALDLAREGTYHLPGGIGDIAVALARALRARGGTVAYSTAATAVEIMRDGSFSVHTASGRNYVAKKLIAAIPIADTAQLLTGEHRQRLRRKMPSHARGFGAGMAYVGLKPGIVPPGFAAHHQCIRSYSAALGEGETTFLSFSNPGDLRRARNGGSTVTISTHTSAQAWTEAYTNHTYDAKKQELQAALLTALEHVLPGASEYIDLLEIATPHTFTRYTGRSGGYVGGVPQMPWLANVFAPTYHSGIPELYLSGDGVFPGQSTVGAAISGALAARAARPALQFNDW